MREMKDSGIEWIGEIPRDWDITQVKYLFKIGRGRVIAQTELTDNGIYPVFSSQTKDNGCLGFIDTYDFDVDQLTWTTDGANAGTVFIRNGKHNCTNVCGTLQPIDKTQSLKFQKYALEHIAFYHKRADTNGYKIMNNEMASIHTMCPPLETQHRIADYLDRKCSKIDEIIAKESLVIEKLKAYKLSVITEAVTKGLNPDVPMKDSGIEWIGMTPQHWIVSKTNKVAKTSSGSTPLRDKDNDFFMENADINWARTLDLNDNIVFETSEKITQLALENSSCKIMPINTVCVAMYGGAGTIGKCGILGIESTTNQAICTIVVDKEKLSPLYLLFQLLALKAYWMKYAVGTRKDPNISQDIVSNMRILVPPSVEQQAIADYLDKKTTQIDETITKKQATIEKLTAYKKSIIYEVVTGKKEV